MGTITCLLVKCHETTKKKYHIYALDIPGFGISQEPPNIWTIKDYSIFINKFVATVQIPHPIIIGHSFGGRIAIVYASKFPVKKLILYSTSGGLPEKSLFKKLHKRVFVNIGKYLFPNFLYKSYATFFKPKQYQNKIIINKCRSKRMLDIYSQPFENLTHALEKITAKTLIFNGRKDPIIAHETGQKLHAIIQNSQLVEIPNATHFAHLESPDIFYAACEKFLADL